MGNFNDIFKVFIPLLTASIEFKQKSHFIPNLNPKEIWSFLPAILQPNVISNKCLELRCESDQKTAFETKWSTKAGWDGDEGEILEWHSRLKPFELNFLNS